MQVSILVKGKGLVTEEVVHSMGVRGRYTTTYNRYIVCRVDELVVHGRCNLSNVVLFF